MSITLDGTSGINNDATNLNYTGTLTGGTGVVNLGSGQFYKDASGNVGIGTSSPAQRLEVSGRVRVTNTASGDFGSDATGAFLSSEGSTPLRFFTGSSERMRIDSSGNLLVGATSTSSKLLVSQSGNSYALEVAKGNSSVATVNIYNGYTASGTATAIRFEDHNSTPRGSITVTTSATAYNTSSDYRLKENIAPMTGALARVAALKPVTYTWKSTGEADEGFIAHELQEVCPSAVTGEKDAVDAEGKPVYQGIDTSFLVATLTAAIQEQQQLITALTARVEALEAQNV
jgi:hypothetical protein